MADLLTLNFIKCSRGLDGIGILVECDHCLNLRIRKATVIRARKAERFDEFFVAGRHLRYVHLDHAVDAAKVIHKLSTPHRKAKGPLKNKAVATKDV
ncbi:hypothetical protein OESDEN_01895 [Oesophagostomum dentatum]|uniref:LSM domain-containing protein n=1 Tax=Oesophagostomum dentatum TaxID=61180 RepID=A0A0B1TLN1_OESDE|nr:hypothetical protein OESDEN_01895 [Oesophagostomum dentatum]